MLPFSATVKEFSASRSRFVESSRTFSAVSSSSASSVESLHVSFN